MLNKHSRYSLTPSVGVLCPPVGMGYQVVAAYYRLVGMTMEAIHQLERKPYWASLLEGSLECMGYEVVVASYWLVRMDSGV